MDPFKLTRLGTIMVPEPGNEQEVEGVLNPAAVRGPDGLLYLFPRVVAKDNYSRIAIVRVLFNEMGNPVGVERLGIALEPEADYEKRPDGGGGVEDPRVTYIEPLACYQMTYTAFGADGPRIAIAQSKDLFNWQRLGLASYLPYGSINFNGVDNKDASLFPIKVKSPHGHLSVAMLHRPLFPGTAPDELVKKGDHRKTELHLESIWISYANLKRVKTVSYHDAKFTSHFRLASPVAPWKALKIGAGAPPVLTRHGWLVVYHGVHVMPGSTDTQPKLCYSAGVMILSINDPQKIIYRSVRPILVPELPEEKVGTIANVVFPTGTDRRDDIGQPHRIDVYYGMADNKIGVAKMIIPEQLPKGGRPDK